MALHFLSLLSIRHVLLKIAVTNADPCLCLFQSLRTNINSWRNDCASLLAASLDTTSSLILKSPFANCGCWCCCRFFAATRPNVLQILSQNRVDFRFWTTWYALVGIGIVNCPIGHCCCRNKVRKSITLKPNFAVAVLKLEGGKWHIRPKTLVIKACDKPDGTVDNF